MLVHGLRLTSHSLNEDVMLCYVMLFWRRSYIVIENIWSCS